MSSSATRTLNGVIYRSEQGVPVEGLGATVTREWPYPVLVGVDSADVTSRKWHIVVRENVDLLDNDVE